MHTLRGGVDYDKRRHDLHFAVGKRGSKTLHQLTQLCFIQRTGPVLVDIIECLLQLRLVWERPHPPNDDGSTEFLSQRQLLESGLEDRVLCG